MTTPDHIQFQIGFGRSTTTASSLESDQVISLQSLAGVGPYRKSRQGKLPRAVVSAMAEASNAKLRSDMQDARQELAAEFMAVEPLSLAKVRLQRGYSQQQLAKAIGTSQPHIANLEAGKIDPSFDTVSRLADALGISMNEIRPLIERAKRKQQNVI